MLGHARSCSSSPLGTLGPLAHPLCVSPTLQHMTIKASLANCLGRVTPAARGFVEGKVEHAVAQLTHMWSLVLSLAALAVVRQLEGGRQLGDLDQGGFCRCRLPPAGQQQEEEDDPLGRDDDDGGGRDSSMDGAAGEDSPDSASSTSSMDVG